MLKSSGSSPWVALGLLWVAFAINYLDRQMIFSMYPLLRRDLGFSDAQLGLIGTVFLWVYSLSMPFTGRLADRARKDRIIIVSIILWSLATLGTGFSTSVSQLLGWRVAMGLSEAMYVPAAVGLLALAHRPEHRSKALAIHQSAQFAGVIAGGWYGGWTADYFGFRAGFFLAAAIGLAYTVVLALALRQREPQQSQHVPAAATAGGFESLLNSGYLALSTAFFMVCAMIWVFYAWLPNMMYERFGLSMTASGLTATVYFQASSAVGVLIGGVAGDRLAGRRPGARLYLVAAGLLFASPFGFLAFSQQTLLLAKLCAVGFGLFQGVMVANTFASAYDVVPRSQFSFAIGVMNMVGGLASGAAILTAGIWKSSIGIPALMQCVAIGAALSAIALWVVTSRRFPQAGSQIVQGA